MSKLLHASILGVAVFTVATLPRISRTSEPSDDLAANRDQAAEQQLKDSEQNLYRKAVSGDSAAVLSVVASDFIGMDAGLWDGKLQSVAQDREALASDVKNTAANLAGASVDDLEARVHGQTGIVRGKAVLKQKNGTTFETHFVDTWEKRNDRWILVATATFSQQQEQ